MDNSTLEKLIKIRVKKGYTLHIGGEYYLENEVIKVRPSQIEDQLWKIEYVKEPVTEPEVINEGITDEAQPEQETVVESEDTKNDSTRKVSSGRRLFKSRKE